MKAKVYIGAKKYAVYIGRKIIEKTMYFFSFPARFFATKDGALKDYKMYGKTVQSNLPEGYTQLESLSSSGYEYINTGLVIQSGDEIQLDYEYLGPTPSELSADMMFFGCQNTDTSRGGVWVETYRRTTGSPSWYVRFGSTTSSSKPVDDQYITGRHLVVLRDSYFAIDGDLIHQPSNIGTFQTTPLTLFGRLNQTGEQLNGSKIKVFGFKVVNNGVVRLNLIPCMNTTGVLGMYDTVTEQFLANAGTGEFIAGTVIGLPDEYTQLEYIVANGKAYVDTGFKANTTTTRFVGAFRLTDVSVSQGFFGSRNGNSANDGSCLALFATSGSYVRGDWISGASNPAVPVTGNTIITFDITRGYGVINGAVYTSTKTTSVDQINNFYVGHFRNGDGTLFSSGIIGHIFPCQLISNDVVIRNLVPAKRNSDEKIGMYDIENNVFYPSVGESEFIAGPVFTIKPTPTNPIAIESVGDKTVNLFNKETITKGKYISQGGAVTSNPSFCYGDYISVVPNRDYIISGNNKGGTAYRRIHAYGADKKWLQQIQALQVQSGADYTMTFTAPEDCAYIRFSGMSSTNDYEETNIVQIEEGSTATAYEPYGYKIPVNVKGENLFNPTSSRNAYMQSPAVGRAVGWKNSTATTTYINCNRVEAGKIYTVSCVARQLAATSARAGAIVGDDDLIKQVITTPQWVVGKNEYSFVATDDGWLYVAVDINSTDISVRFNQTTNIYLDEPLRKLGDLTDYIDFENQKVFRKVGAEKLGTTNWTYESNYTRFSRDFSAVKSAGTRMTYMLTDGFTAFTAGTGIATVPNNAVYTGASTSKAIYFKTDAYTTVSAFTGALSETYIYFPITPKEESITLPAIALQKGNMTMDIETKIKPSQLTITGDIDDVR